MKSGFACKLLFCGTGSVLVLSKIISSYPTKFRNGITNYNDVEPEGQPASTQLALLLPRYKRRKVHLRLLEAEGEDHTQKEVQ